MTKKGTALAFSQTQYANYVKISIPFQLQNPKQRASNTF